MWRRKTRPTASMEQSNSCPGGRLLLRIFCKTSRTDAVAEPVLQIGADGVRDIDLSAPASRLRCRRAAKRNAAGFANELTLAIRRFHVWVGCITKDSTFAFAAFSTRVLVSARYRLRESGVSPELSRSGKQERPPSFMHWFASRIGKQRPVGKFQACKSEDLPTTGAKRRFHSSLREEG